MLRITLHAPTHSRIELRLAGRIGAEEVALLESELHRLSQNGTLLVLDLEGILFIDRAGLDLLETWVGEGMQLRGGSAFIQKVLTAHGLKGGK